MLWCSEKAVAEQFVAMLNGNNIFDKFHLYWQVQFTESALLKVSNDIMMARDARKSIILILLDLRTAFDTIIFFLID